MILYNCDFCGGVHTQVHVLLVEDKMGVLHIVTLCDDCADKESELDYKYLLLLKGENKEDKYGLFN